MQCGQFSTSGRTVVASELRDRPQPEREGFLDDYRSATSALTARGNLVPDAHIATILRQHGVRLLYTSDRDFRRFEFLDVRDPFEKE